MLRERRESTSDWIHMADVARGVARLADKSLLVAAGMSARASGLDGGLCSLADALLREVAGLDGPPWAAATIPSAAYAVDDRDHVIRLAWPGDGIWTLPLALHELGHYVSRRLEKVEVLDPERNAIVRPLEEQLMATGEEQPVEWHHLQELFADAYASYVGGPAYLGCCVDLGLHPGEPTRASRSHPAPADRIRLVVGMLRKMGERADNTASMAFEVDGWKRAWDEASDAPDDAAPRGPQTDVTRFWGSLHELLPNARYRTLNTAMRLGAHLRSGLGEPDLTGVSMVDILNGCWCLRREVTTPGDLAAVEARGRRLLSLAAGHV
jgi:hypothetical protein